MTSCLQTNEVFEKLIKENVEVIEEVEPEDLPPEVLKDLLPSVTITGPEITNYSILDEVTVLNLNLLI